MLPFGLSPSYFNLHQGPLDDSFTAFLLLHLSCCRVHNVRDPISTEVLVRLDRHARFAASLLSWA